MSLAIDYGSMYIHNIPAGGSFTQKGDSSERVTYGLENKGFEMRSDYPVTATLGGSSHSNTHSPDEMLLRPVTANDTEFFIISFLGISRSSSGFPQSFFMITATEDNTSVSILDNDGNSYSDHILER